MISNKMRIESIEITNIITEIGINITAVEIITKITSARMTELMFMWPKET